MQMVEASWLASRMHGCVAMAADSASLVRATFIFTKYKTTVYEDKTKVTNNFMIDNLVIDKVVFSCSSTIKLATVDLCTDMVTTRF